MSANDNHNLQLLPDLFPWLQHQQQQTQDDSLTTLDEILSSSSPLAPLNHTPSSTPIIHRPASQIINTAPSPVQRDVTFSSLINSNKFKTSLKTVLSRPQSRALHQSEHTLSKKLPDRNCDNPVTRRYPDRNIRIPRTQSHKHSREQTPKHTRSSQDLTPKSTPSLRKVRSSSCSKLPPRRSQETPVKRPCDLADRAIAEGTPLSKEQARAIRNRQHAMASRLRAKQKRQTLESDNKELKNRVKMLEEENLTLIRVRDALRFQQALDFGSISNPF